MELGVRISRIGGPVEHRGERVLSAMAMSSIEERLPRSVRRL
jgi:hypothetical protein